VFRDLLLEVKFPLAGLYAAAVELFGPQDFHGVDAGRRKR
jgi:hypothetical protein